MIGDSALQRFGRSVALCALLGSAVPGPLAAQGRTAQSPNRPEPGAELTISVLTMGVGAEVWERFGHNAIVVEDRSRGTSPVSYTHLTLPTNREV